MSLVSGDWVLVASGELRGPEASGETRRIPVRIVSGAGYIYRVAYVHREFLASRVATGFNVRDVVVWYDDGVVPQHGSHTVYFPAMQYLGGYEDVYSITVASVAHRLAPSVVGYRIDVLEYHFPEGWRVFTFRGFGDGVATVYPFIDRTTFGHHDFLGGGRVRVRLVSPFDGVEATIHVEVRLADRPVYGLSGTVGAGGEAVFDVPVGVRGLLVINPVVKSWPISGQYCGFLLIRVEYAPVERPPEKPPEKPHEEPRPPPSFPSPWDALKELLRRLLRDEEPVGIDPVVTKSLIAILFTILTYTAANLNYWVERFGLVPYLLLLGSWHGLVTHFWLHAGWEHYISNALFLYVFGDNVEERLGYVRYVLFYLSAGLVAGLGFVAYQLSVGDLYTPAVGASGAISGVMGVYSALFPRARLVFMGREMPAAAFTALWLVGQFALAFQHTNIAWIAHVVGFVYGALVGLLLRSRETAD